MIKRSAADEAEFMQLARDRWKQAESADNDQLAREIDDLRFLVDQWPDQLRTSRAGQNASAGLPPIPARPCLNIDTLRDPIAHVKAEAEQTDLGPEIVAADDFSSLVGPIDDTEIELREGLVRKIQRDSNARDARNWAADRGRKAGRGFYLVMTRYASMRSVDKEVYIEKLYNQASVKLDPRHEQSDGSDCEWEFYGTDMSWERYKSEHPHRASKQAADGDEGAEWRGLGDAAPGWFTGSEVNTRSVRVMNYYHTVYDEPVKLVALDTGELVEEKDVAGRPLMLDDEGQPFTREYAKKTIYWAKIDGAQILDETEWESPHMPIVKVVWEEMQPYDNERRIQGMVRPARDPAFGVSVMASTEVEVALLAPKTPIVGAAGTFDGFEAAWDQANVRNIGRLEYNPNPHSVPEGSNLGPPTALVRNTEAAVGTWDGLRAMFVQAVKNSTGVPDATLGNVDPSVRSGRAIRQLIEQSSKGTSGGLANLVKSVTYEAKIINSLLYPIYGRRKGRLMQIMTGKYESESVMVGKPFLPDAKGRPVPVDASVAGPQPPAQPGQPPLPQPKEFKLTKDADFNVAIRVAKDYDTKRQEETSLLGELIGNSPELMTWFGDLLFENQDGPGHKEMAERAKLMLAPPILASMQEQQGGLPPAAKAQMDALQSKLQQAEQFIQTKQVEQQGKVEIEKAKIAADAQNTQAKLASDVQKIQAQTAADVHIAQVNNAAKIAVARISAAKSMLDIQAEAAEERLATGLQQQHDVRMAEMGHAQAREATADAQGHERGMTAVSHGHEQETMERQAELSAGQQAAQQTHEQQMAQQAAEQAAKQPNGAQ